MLANLIITYVCRSTDTKTVRFYVCILTIFYIFVTNIIIYCVSIKSPIITHSL